MTASLTAYQINGVWWHALAEHLGPWVRLDLRELELRVVGVHGVDLLLGGCAQHLDDLHQLVDAALTCVTAAYMAA